MTLNLKGEGEEVPTLATTLEVLVVSPPVPTLATALEVVSPMILNLKGEEMPTPATTLEGAEMVASPTVPTTMEVTSPMTLNLKGEEMPTHTTTLEGSDSDSDAAACPTTTNSLKPKNPMTNAGQGSPKTSTRPTKTNAAEIPSCLGMGAETPTRPMPPPPTRATSA
jgi:hypothetical protein